MSDAEIALLVITSCKFAISRNSEDTPAIQAIALEQWDRLKLSDQLQLKRSIRRATNASGTNRFSPGWQRILGRQPQVPNV